MIINKAWCKGCGICVSFCPKDVFTQVDDGVPQATFAERCNLCGLCELMCPDLAITTGKVWSRAARRSTSPYAEVASWPTPPGSPDRNDGAILMQGNEACVEGAIAAGIRFYAGYPITPASEIAEMFSRRLPSLGGVFIQMEDEIASIAAVIGASMGGMRAMTATSGPGFSLMQENLGYASAAEVPCVIVDVQRAGPSTGLSTGPAQGDVMQSRWGTHGDHPVIVLAPSSVSETYWLTARAFSLAERYRVPVILLTDEIVAHMRETVHLPDVATLRPAPAAPVGEKYRPYETQGGDVPPFVSFGRGARYHITGLHHDTAGFSTERPDEVGPLMERLKRKIDGHVDEIALVEEDQTADADVVVLSYGISARAARHAVHATRQVGYKAGSLKLLTLWPFPAHQVTQLCSRARAVIVPEMNQGQLRLEVERVIGSRSEVIGVNRVDGVPISPEQIVEVIKQVC
ncbi:MAG: 2-oxoacid:acceptor oxidoreductase subunit alpha [Chloroflexota bacterium]|nr:MAG: 2-oxoacid:acceptor oxidoreductase subunit alpha [Chloroflexota bacterium]